jgi:hypothetical protein
MVSGPYDVVEDHPEFVSQDRRSVWIFKITEDYVYRSPLKGHYFRAKWLKVDRDGTITIPKDYAWDGCTPKFSILDLSIVGTPDGIVDVGTGKPKTYHASLVHDALYQYLRWHDISRKDADGLFLLMMQEREFFPARVYHAGVRLFGGFFAKGKHPKQQEVLGSLVGAGDG